MFVFISSSVLFVPHGTFSEIILKGTQIASGICTRGFTIFVLFEVVVLFFFLKKLDKDPSGKWYVHKNLKFQLVEELDMNCQSGNCANNLGVGPITPLENI